MQNKYQPIIEESLEWIDVSKKQDNSENNNNEENLLDSTPYDQLDEIKKLAVRLRANLLPYKIVQKRIKEQFQKEYVEDTLQHWFDKSGVCRQALEYYKQKLSIQLELELIEANNILKQAGITSLSLLADSLIEEDKYTESQKATARDLLDRSGFAKSNKIDLNQKIESKAMDQLAEDIHTILSAK